jgi:hypothetical protein
MATVAGVRTPLESLASAASSTGSEEPPALAASAPDSDDVALLDHDDLEPWQTRHTTNDSRTLMPTQWSFPKDNNGRIWPVNPDGKVHVPVGGLVTTDGGWGGVSPTAIETARLRDVYGLNTLRILTGELGSPISNHNAPHPAKESIPPLTNTTTLILSSMGKDWVYGECMSRF